MLLVVDVGNSHMVLGLYDGEELRGRWRVVTANYRTGDELQILLYMLMQAAGIDRKSIFGCCAASVVPQLNTALEQVCQATFGFSPLLVEPGVRTGLVLQCDNPKEVGADRIVNAVGAIAEYKGALIVVDFGTATTFDAVTARGEWRGGVIVPGVQLAADALFEHCAKLPRVEIRTPATVIGRDTVTNITSGLTYGYADMVDGLAPPLAAEMDDQPTVVATGGFSQTIAEVSSEIGVVDPLLTLKGLRAVFLRNRGETP